MHRPHSRVVQSCRDGERLLNLSVVVLHHKHLRPVQDARRTLVDGRRRMVRLPAVASSLRQYDSHALVVHIVVDGARRITAAADAGDEVVGIVASRLLLQLPPDLLRDDTLHARHQIGIRMRSHRRAHNVERVLRMTTPVAYCLRTGVAERHVTCTNGMHLGAQHPHALHIRVLALHVGSSHEHLAAHTHQGAHRSRSHTVLSGSRLGDDACLPHLPRQQNLSDSVVNLVRTRVVQVLALQKQAAAVALAHPARIVERRRPPHIVLQQRVILRLKLLRLDDRQVGVLQVVNTLIEDFRHVCASELPVEAVLVYLIMVHMYNSF